MKTRFKIFTEHKLIIACFKGTIGYQDILQWVDNTREHPEFSQNFSGLLDLRKAVFAKRSGVKMVEKARNLAEHMIKTDFTTGNWAILADTPMETSLMMVYSKSASQKHPIKIFSTVEAAEDFLGVSLADALKDMSV